MNDTHRAPPRSRRTAVTRGVDGLPAAAPPAEYLSAAQVAALLGVSLRKFVDLRHAEWMPQPIELGPRCLRWRRAELVEAIDTRAQRAGARPVEPQLVAGQRAKRERLAAAVQKEVTA